MSTRPVARAPFAVRAALIASAVILMLAAAWICVNLFAVTSYNEATAALHENVEAVTDDAADLDLLLVRQQQVDAQFDQAAGASPVLLPQVREPITANAQVSRQLTQRIQEAIDTQHQGNESDGSAADGQSVQDVLESEGLTEEQRQRIEELLESNQSSTPSDSEQDGDSTGTDKQSSEVKPW